MKITFDPKKDEWTRRERGLSLALGAKIIANAVVIEVDDRKNYGEDRLIAYGHVEKRLHICVFTMRHDVTRIISVRKANEREIRKYGR